MIRAILALLAAALLVACTSAPTWSPPIAPDLATAGPPVPDSPITEATFTAPLAAMFAPLAAPFVTPHVRVPGAIRIETGDTPCEYEKLVATDKDGNAVLDVDGNPILYEMPRPQVVVDWREPQVGRVVSATFWSMGVSAPPWPQFLLAEIRDTYDTSHFSAEALGLPGCWLHVDLARAFPVWPGSDPDNWCRRDGAHVHVQFRPTLDLLGKTVVLQSVLFAPRDVVRTGIVLGPALLVCVGEPR